MIEYQPEIQQLLRSGENQIDVLRLDRVHSEISGNKWFKLKYNIAELLRNNKSSLLTFGGPYSNHIAATAAACKEFGITSIGCIRGDSSQSENPTLKGAARNGMILHFLDRETYKRREESDVLDPLLKKFGDPFMIPEGGSNTAGILGCKEILQTIPHYDYILCACGTGTTYAGLLISGKCRQSLIGISVLKGLNTLPEKITQCLLKFNNKPEYRIFGNEELSNEVIENHCITNRYAFSGYANFEPELITFKKEFENRYAVPLDHIYTVKLAYAMFDLISQSKIRKGSSALMIHSGGLQGNEGFEKRYHERLKR